MSGVVARDGFIGNEYLRFNNLVSAQDTYAKLFTASASAAHITGFADVLGSKPALDRQAIRKSAQTKGAAAETLAAFAPMASAEGACAEALAVPADSVHVHSFDLLGQRCHLSAVGPAKPNMRDAAQAMGRIFSEAA